jgi:hypothetical protein
MQPWFKKDKKEVIWLKYSVDTLQLIDIIISSPSAFPSLQSYTLHLFFCQGKKAGRMAHPASRS